MASQRRYGDPCGVARSLDVVGDRWALLIVRDLLLGPKRFKDLLDGLLGASPNVITQRLGELTDAGIVRRRRLPAPAGVWVYELTTWGRELEPVLLHLGRWGAAAPYQSDRRVLGHDSLLLGLKATLDPADVTRLAGVYQLWLDGEPFTVRIGEAGLTAERGQADDAETVIHTDAETLTAVVTGAQSARTARADNRLSVTGPPGASSRALALLGGPRNARGSRRGS